MKLIDHRILLERMRRQRLLEPIEHPMNHEEYLALFRLLQPVSPAHYTRPGDPPRLVHRTAFYDYDLSSDLRSRQQYVKGRFQGGRVGYVMQEDLYTYAKVFRKIISKPKVIHEDVLSYIRSSGGCSKDQIKAELDYPAGQISKALQDLQSAFLVYEDQLDTDWDTGWFDFASEWFEIRPTAEEYHEALSLVITNFLKAMVFATDTQIKSWSQLPRRTIREALQHLEAEGKIVQVSLSRSGEGYMLAEDMEIELPDETMPQTVYMLDQSDIIVRAHLDELKKRYQGHEVLQYLLIDGELQGCVVGHWRISPYDIDDVIVDLDETEAEARKEEILDAVRKIYSPDTQPVLHYNGSSIY